MSAPSDLKDLLARVEKATGPDRELSDRIAEVAGYRENHARDPHRFWFDPDGREFLGYPPHFTESIDAALALVERVLPGWDYCLSKGFGGPTLAALAPSDQAIGVEVTAPTPALAVICSLLKALLAKENDRG